MDRHRETPDASVADGGSRADRLRDGLGVELRRAMKARDHAAVSAVRSALAAIANAEAVPVSSVPPAGALETSPVGVGATEAARRVLGDEEVRLVVQGEVDERMAAASQVEGVDRERADRLRAEARLLARLSATHLS